MSEKNFLSYLQQLLSMVDPEDKYSIALAQMALDATVELARGSGKANPVTLRMMIAAKGMFRRLVAHRDDYAGVPGEYETNKQKRRRLAMMFQPGC